MTLPPSEIGGAAMARRRLASATERQRLRADFVRLCEIESPSLRERAVAEDVTGVLEGLGLSVEEDASAAETGSDCGNLIARVDGPQGAESVLFCAHLDTVPLAGPVEVVEADGVLTNGHEAILGADNKAAVAVLLGLARRFADDPPPLGIELLFTTGEELAMRGVKEVDRAQLRSSRGYVFDHASPIGELIVAAPTYYRLLADFQGAAAHAGIAPEAGRSAIAAAARAIDRMPAGRLDPETTANVGTIGGGSASNVVAEHCRVEVETRSLDDDRASAVVSELVDACAAAASELECDVETTVEQLFRCYRLTRSAPVVSAAAAALQALGIEPSYVSTGGGSDANVLIAAGLPTLNVANGTERNHRPDERVTVVALETALDLALSLVTQSTADVA